MSKINVTFDDFDPLLVYSDYTQWSTPNPQNNPTWYNASESETGVPWHEATIHYTTIQGASFAFNFTASSAWIYGAVGPSSSATSYTITLDGTSSSHTAENTTSSDNTLGQGRTLLWSAQGLDEGKLHEVELRNEGSGVGVDLVVLEVDVGENTNNSTLDNTSPEISYSGTWDMNNGSFHGGSSSYTQGAGNEFSFNFTGMFLFKTVNVGKYTGLHGENIGSALYIYGDQVNDHGLYSIFFNTSTIPYATYNGRSGCAVGGVEKSCEKLGTLKIFVGGLGEGEHQVRLVNEGQETYFGEYCSYCVYRGKTLVTDERGQKILIISNTLLHQLIPLSLLIQRAPTVFAPHPLQAITLLEPLVRPQVQSLLRLHLLRVIVRVLRCMAMREDMQG